MELSLKFLSEIWGWRSGFWLVTSFWRLNFSVQKWSILTLVESWGPVQNGPIWHAHECHWRIIILWLSSMSYIQEDIVQPRTKTSHQELDNLQQCYSYQSKTGFWQAKSVFMLKLGCADLALKPPTHRILPSPELKLRFILQSNKMTSRPSRRGVIKYSHWFLPDMWQQTGWVAFRNSNYCNHDDQIL